MKFIGQFIQDFIARFRNDVYLEDLTEAAQDHVVGVDAAGKLYKQDVAVGDITNVRLNSDTGTHTESSGTANFVLTGGNAIETTNSTNDFTINHEDTSTQVSVNNSGTTFIQDVTLDTYGHVTGLTSADVFSTTQQPVYIQSAIIPQAVMNNIHSTPVLLVPSITGKTIVPLTMLALSSFNAINTNSRANLNFGYFINPTTPFSFTNGMIAQMRRFAYNHSADYLALVSPQGMRAFSGTATSKPLAVSGEPGFGFTNNCFRDVNIAITYTLI